MDTKTTVSIIVALLVGVAGGYFVGNSNAPAPAMDHSAGNMQTSMDGMMADLVGKTGDEFDKAFLSGMIEHHQGAVHMAEAALKDAKHSEIKQMAEAIISAQTTEIDQMKQWQSDWYGQE